MLAHVHYIIVRDRPAWPYWPALIGFRCPNRNFNILLAAASHILFVIKSPSLVPHLPAGLVQCLAVSCVRVNFLILCYCCLCDGLYKSCQRRGDYRENKYSFFQIKNFLIRIMCVNIMCVPMLLASESPVRACESCNAWANYALTFSFPFHLIFLFLIFFWAIIPC